MKLHAAVLDRRGFVAGFADEAARHPRPSSDRLKLDVVEHVFDLLHEGEAVRQVVVFD